MRTILYSFFAVIISLLCISFASAATVPWDRIQVGTQVPLYGDGIRVTASSTIGGGTQTTGLTVSGGATTTGLTVLTANTSGYQAPLGSNILQVLGADGDAARITLDAFTGTPNFIYRAAEGTAASPSATINGRVLGNISFFGYAPSGYTSTNRASILVVSAQDWTDSAQGTYMRFATTPLGGVTASERVRIDPDGNLAVGVTDPKNRFEVAATTTDTSTGLQGSFRSLRTAIVSGNLIGGFNARTNDTNLTAPGLPVGSVYFVANQTHTAATQGTDLVFTTTNSGGTATNTEKVRITGAGNLGVGTPSPLSELDVRGDESNDEIATFRQDTRSSNIAVLSLSTASSYINLGYPANANNGQILYSNNANRFTFRVNDTDSMYLNSTGLGIGTTTPWRQLSVGTNNTGKFAISTSTAGCAQFSTLGEVYSTGSACGTGGGSVGNWFTPTTFGSTAANATSTLLGMTQGLYALASSTIGSGTQTGGLTISGGATTTGNAYVAGGSIISTDPGFVTTNIQNTDATPNFQINSSGASASTLMYRYSNNATPPRIFFLKDRGTTSATYAAVSAGDQLGAFSWAGGNGTKAAEAAQIRVYTTGAQTGTLYTPGAIGLWTSPGGSVAPSERLTVYSDGRVGIGTSSPSAKLSVHAAATDTNNTLFAIGSSTASATTTLFKVDNAGGVTVSGLGTAAGTFVAADPTGKLIATTTPTSGGSTVSVYATTTSQTGGGSDTVTIPPISMVAGDSLTMMGTVIMNDDCTGGATVLNILRYKLSTYAATTSMDTAKNNGGTGGSCSASMSHTFVATTTVTVTPQLTSSGSTNPTDLIDFTVQKFH